MSIRYKKSNIKNICFMMLLLGFSMDLVCWTRKAKKEKKHDIQQLIAEFNNLMVVQPVELSSEVKNGEIKGDEGAGDREKKGDVEGVSIGIIKRTPQENRELAERLMDVADILGQDGFSVSSPLITKHYNELLEKPGTASFVAREFEKQARELYVQLQQERHQGKEKQIQIEGMQQTIALGEKALDDRTKELETQTNLLRDTQATLAQKEKVLSDVEQEVGGLRQQLTDSQIEFQKQLRAAEFKIQEQVEQIVALQKNIAAITEKIAEVALQEEKEAREKRELQKKEELAKEELAKEELERKEEIEKKEKEQENGAENGPESVKEEAEKKEEPAKEEGTVKKEEIVKEEIKEENGKKEEPDSEKKEVAQEEKVAENGSESAKEEGTIEKEEIKEEIVKEENGKKEEPESEKKEIAQEEKVTENGSESVKEEPAKKEEMAKEEVQEEKKTESKEEPAKEKETVKKEEIKEEIKQETAKKEEPEKEKNSGQEVKNNQEVPEWHQESKK